jgi:hypothetical protein
VVLKDFSLLPIAERSLGPKSVMWSMVEVAESGFGPESVIGGGEIKRGPKPPLVDFMYGGD